MEASSARSSADPALIAALERALVALADALEIARGPQPPIVPTRTEISRRTALPPPPPAASIRHAAEVFDDAVKALSRGIPYE